MGPDFDLDCWVLGLGLVSWILANVTDYRCHDKLNCISIIYSTARTKSTKRNTYAWNYTWILIGMYQIKAWKHMTKYCSIFLIYQKSKLGVHIWSLEG
jgi:hypothetical protein